MKKIWQFVFGEKIKRRQVSDVKSGDWIRIEWNRAKSGYACPQVIENDPLKKMIFVRQRWSNYEEARCDEYTYLLLGYNDIRLKNFHVLNPHLDGTVQDGEGDEFSELQQQLKEALDAEEYLKANEIQDKINRITEKK